MMTEDELIRRSIDAAFSRDFDQAFSRGLKRELSDLDHVHAVSGLAEENGRQRRAACGIWVDRNHGLDAVVTCPICLKALEDDAKDEAAMLKMFLGDRA